MRAALGASTGALRRMLLAKAFCSAAPARARCSVRAADGDHPGRYASRFSVRALDLTVDNSMLWVGAALAIVAR